MARRPLPTSAADWLILAVTPALLIGMVTCLLFFILAVFYRGDFNERLHWILFAGVVGMVLIGRIHLIEEISRRAGFYSGILGILVVIALIQFVPPPPGWPALGHYGFCAGLVALGFWATRILVADTTDIHSETTIDGEGLLRAAGLEDDPAARLRRDVERRTADSQTGKSGQGKRNKGNREKAGEGDSSPEAVEAGSRNRRKAPGVTVVWFSALALPIFGIGQGFIPPEELKTRWYTLMLLVGYLGCGFLLLLTSSFLGFRRYLAKRGLSMPGAMAGVWIVGGMLLVGTVLLVSLLIPRPSDIGPLQTLSALTGQKIEPIRRKEKPAGDNPGEKQNPGKDMNDRRDDAKGREKPSPDGAKDSSKPGNKGEKGAGKGQGKSGQAKGEAKNAQGKAGNQEKDGQGKNQDGGNQKDQQDRRDGQEKGDQGKQQSRDREGEKKGLGEGKKQGDKTGQAQEKEGSNKDNSSPPPPPESNAGQFSQAIRTLLKLMAAGLAVGVAIAFAAVCLTLGWSPAETLNRWIAWLQGLFRRKVREGVWSPKENGKDEEPLPAFGDFPDPFSGRKALPPRELVRVTFRAVQAWGADQGDPMLEGETPNEYFRRLAGLHPIVEEGLQEFCQWHDLAEYARDQPLEGCREPIRELWRGLRDGARRDPRVAAGAT